MSLNETQASFSASTAMQDGRLRKAQLKMITMLQAIDSICGKHGFDYWLEGGTLLGAIRHQGFIPWDDDLDISMPRESYEAFLNIAPQELPNHMWLQTAQSDPGYFNLSVPLKIRDCNSLFIEMHETGNEPYQKGIFIDVFVYDKMSNDQKIRTSKKFLAKKLLRLLQHKYSRKSCGHYASLYRFLSRFFSKSQLEKKLNAIITEAQSLETPYLGYGYDCVNTNLVCYEDIYPLKRANFEDNQFNIPNRSEVILQQLYGDYMSLPPQASRVMKHCRTLIPDLGVEL
ncbi:LicD family protein [Legionella yabuuchiae]|uniref:LicD family protein n=1 Tax=Legionella yabuuchiae TaxID=376727 RepID=UPI001F5E42EA|nr:LicD family protein [Legionella yabuuchiae]